MICAQCPSVITSKAVSPTDALDRATSGASSLSRSRLDRSADALPPSAGCIKACHSLLLGKIVSPVKR